MEGFIKVAPIIITGITAVVAMWKYFYEKNRVMYERRLNEVYAPLYGFLVAQETFRKMYMPDVDIVTAPILTSEKRIDNTKLTLNNMQVSHNSKTEVGFFDRNNFVKIINESNTGLARPKLLILIKQYELLVYLEESTSKESENWKRATKKKVEVEYELFKEIAEGYESTIRLLKLDGAEHIYDLENMNI